MPAEPKKPLCELFHARVARPHWALRGAALVGGVLLLVVGLIGWIVPVMPGIPFYFAGFALLGVASDRVRRRVNRAEEQLPHRWRLRVRSLLGREPV